jgi:hypothetical protein
MTNFAELEQLPPVLREPPWASGRRAPEPGRMCLPPLHRRDMIHWPPEEHARALEADAPNVDGWRLDNMSVQQYALSNMCLTAEAQARVGAGEPLTAEDVAAPPVGEKAQLGLLRYLPAATQQALWNAMPTTQWDPFTFDTSLAGLLARHREAAIPGLLAYCKQRPVQGLRVAQRCDGPSFAALALHAMRGARFAQHAAASWLLAHPETAAQVLLRQLFGEDDTARDDALATLHAPAVRGLRPAVEEAARGLGPPVIDALREQLDADPLLRLPMRMPRPPTFFVPAALHRPRLTKDGTALPDDAMHHLGTMLAISKPDQPYAGLDAVRAACTSASLAEFVWTVFEAWWAAGAPSKDAWCFASLAWFGDDSTAHCLGARTLRMAKEGAKNRAQTAVDMLADFGSDAALMHLNSLVERCKVPAVRNRAAAKIDAVAQARGLSRIELADRLVPTLGLDESRVLDFGPRQFEIGFDETLTPIVLDAQRARLKDLPRPRQSDDAAKAAAASLRWRQLKTEIKSLARVQIARLEQSMVDQRRWAVDDFRAFFVTHPLMRELAARLLWAVYDANERIVDACRVAEDGTLADAQDRAYQPPADAQLGIAHPLALPPGLVDAFKLQFADYEVLQAFPQLTREVFALTPADAAQSSLNRFDRQEVATGAVIGLLDRGWLRGTPQDGGMIQWIDRPLGQGLVARLQLVPGMPVTRLSGEPRQTLGKLDAFDLHSKAETSDPDQATPFAKANPIAISETLRDLHRLVPSSLRTP